MLFKLPKNIQDQLANLPETGMGYQMVRLVKFIYLSFIAIAVLTLLFSLCAPFLMTFFLGKSFKGATNFVIWIAGGYAFDCMYYLVANQIFYAKATHLLAVATFVTSIIHISISYSLIKYNGAIGSAQATTVSFFLTFIMVWILSARVCPMPWFSFFKKPIKI